MNREFGPTLWRTCRVLANRQRLLILRCILRKSPQTVGEIACRLRLGTPLASQYLRMLQARGLIRSDRAGREVYYSDRADPLVRGAAELLRAMQGALTPSDSSLTKAMFALTAFTHPRRIQIVRALGSTGMSAADLSSATRISARALRRHLAKLRRRGVIVQGEDGFVSRSNGGSPLMRYLVRLAIRN